MQGLSSVTASTGGGGARTSSLQATQMMQIPKTIDLHMLTPQYQMQVFTLYQQLLAQQQQQQQQHQQAPATMHHFQPMSGSIPQAQPIQPMQVNNMSHATNNSSNGNSNHISDNPFDDF